MFDMLAWLFMVFILTGWDSGKCQNMLLKCAKLQKQTRLTVSLCVVLSSLWFKWFAQIMYIMKTKLPTSSLGGPFFFPLTGGTKMTGKQRGEKEDAETCRCGRPAHGPREEQPEYGQQHYRDLELHRTNGKMAQRLFLRWIVIWRRDPK